MWTPCFDTKPSKVKVGPNLTPENPTEFSLCTYSRFTTKLGHHHHRSISGNFDPRILTRATWIPMQNSYPLLRTVLICSHPHLDRPSHPRHRTTASRFPRGRELPFSVCFGKRQGTRGGSQMKMAILSEERYTGKIGRW